MLLSNSPRRFFTFIYGFVVVEATDQRQIVAQRVNHACAGVVLIPDVFQLAGVDAHSPAVPLIE